MSRVDDSRRLREAQTTGDYPGRDRNRDRAIPASGSRTRLVIAYR
jgi:hypothetical protein